MRYVVKPKGEYTGGVASIWRFKSSIRDTQILGTAQELLQSAVFQYGDSADFPTDKHRQDYTDADAQAVCDWLNERGDITRDYLSNQYVKRVAWNWLTEAPHQLEYTSADWRHIFRELTMEY